MEISKEWPPLEESPQFLFGFMSPALKRYPWENGYQFNFEDYYPPIPDDLRWIRKLLDSVRNKVPTLVPVKENTEYCPICNPPSRNLKDSDPDPDQEKENCEAMANLDLNCFTQKTQDILRLYPRTYPKDPIPATMDSSRVMAPPLKSSMEDSSVLDLANSPVLDMDPIPCPFHIMNHLWPPFDFPEAGPYSRPYLITPKQLDDTKKYLEQLRRSRGYDVDCDPHPALVNFSLVNLDLNVKTEARLLLLKIIKEHLGAAIKYSHSKTGNHYKVVEILKVVHSSYRVFLVTFTAMEVGPSPSPAPETFIATLNLWTPKSTTIAECLLKPDYDAPIPHDLPLYDNMGPLKLQQI